MTSGEELSWDELGAAFETAGYAPGALVLSSCLAATEGLPARSRIGHRDPR
jgi:hypothetical protein